MFPRVVLRKRIGVHDYRQRMRKVGKPAPQLLRAFRIGEVARLFDGLRKGIEIGKELQVVCQAKRRAFQYCGARPVRVGVAGGLFDFRKERRNVECGELPQLFRQFTAAVNRIKLVAALQ